MKKIVALIGMMVAANAAMSQDVVITQAHLNGKELLSAFVSCGEPLVVKIQDSSITGIQVEPKNLSINLDLDGTQSDNIGAVSWEKGRIHAVSRNLSYGKTEFVFTTAHDGSPLKLNITPIGSANNTEWCANTVAGVVSKLTYASVIGAGYFAYYAWEATKVVAHATAQSLSYLYNNYSSTGPMMDKDDCGYDSDYGYDSGDDSSLFESNCWGSFSAVFPVLY